jgi:hypothetical protein
LDTQQLLATLKINNQQVSELAAVPLLGLACSLSSIRKVHRSLLLEHILHHIILMRCFVAAYAGYTQLAPVKGQWDITLKATRTANKDAFEAVDCTEDRFSAACNQPLLSADAKDKLQVTAALKKSPIKTIDDLTPKRVVIKACYTRPSAVDRPWRKSNDVIDVSASPATAAAICCLLCTEHALEALFVCTAHIPPAHITLYTACQPLLAQYKLTCPNPCPISMSHSLLLQPHPAAAAAVIPTCRRTRAAPLSSSPPSSPQTATQWSGPSPRT